MNHLVSSYSDLRQCYDLLRGFESDRNGFSSPGILIRYQLRINDHQIPLVLVDSSGGLTTVNVQQLENTLLMLGDAEWNKYLQITVGSQYFDMLCFLKFLQKF